VAFNSESYYRNKWRRQALAELTEAREIKANGHSWKTVESAVRYARSSWRLYLSQARICELSRESRNLNRPPHRHKAPYRPASFTTRLESDNG
jgi:hypothetical protein